MDEKHINFVLTVVDQATAITNFMVSQGYGFLDGLLQAIERHVPNLEHERQELKEEIEELERKLRGDEIEMGELLEMDYRQSELTEESEDMQNQISALKEFAHLLTDFK